MPAPGVPFALKNLALAGAQLIVAGPGVLEHLQVNNTDPSNFLWLQLFDLPAPPGNGAIPDFVFPLRGEGAMFWTPPAAAAGGMAVIGWKFLNGIVIASSDTPSVLTLNAYVTQWWAWGRGTEP